MTFDAYNPENEYTVTVTDSLGCQTISNPITPIVKTKAQAIFSYTVSTADPMVLFFEDQSPSNTIAWYWDFGNTQTSNTQYPIHDFSTQGSYDVRLTVENDQGCSHTSSQNIIIDHTLTSSPQDILSNQTINIYPNPASNILVLEFEETEQPFDEIQIVNAQGKIMLQTFAEQHLNDSRIAIPIEHLSQGFYMVVVKKEENHITKPIIVR